MSQTSVKKRKISVKKLKDDFEGKEQKLKKKITILAAKVAAASEEEKTISYELEYE